MIRFIENPFRYCRLPFCVRCYFRRLCLYICSRLATELSLSICDKVVYLLMLWARISFHEWGTKNRRQIVVSISKSERVCIEQGSKSINCRPKITLYNSNVIRFALIRTVAPISSSRVLCDKLSKKSNVEYRLCRTFVVMHVRLLVCHAWSGKKVCYVPNSILPVVNVNIIHLPGIWILLNPFVFLCMLTDSSKYVINIAEIWNKIPRLYIKDENEMLKSVQIKMANGKCVSMDL